MDIDDKKSKGGMISSLFQVNNSEVSDIGNNFQNIADPTSLTATAKVKEGSFLGFLDPIAGITNVLGFIWKSLTSPLQLLFNPNLLLPFEFRMMIGLPLTVLWIFSIISFFRSGE